MRIAQVCPYSLTPPGGVQAQVLGLARSMRSLGHEVRVLAPCDGPPPDAGVTPLGKSVPLAANGSVAPIAPDPACALRTIRALRDEEFDVVHLQEPLVPGPTVTSLLVSDRPVVGTFHRAGASAAYAAFRPIAKGLANRLAMRCAVSEDARATAVEAVGGEYELVFNGIEVDRFAKADEITVDGPSILFLGRHEPRKGLVTLLEALAHLPGDVRLLVASDGPETSELRSRFSADPRIEWLGRITDEEKAGYLRGVDAFCAPSIGGESFGVVLLEAMAASAPIVASDLPGYRNVANPDVHALLVPPGDPRALAASLTRVLEDGALRRRLVEAGDARANEFSMDRLAERYLDLYAGITG
ncbi:MAG TPA: glycosyltransferase family 4 protein [Acidimicrobiales bacterium]|nr:glycosyltransferase family 4 protein [Acidimicrobiales bacterium]